MSYKKTARRSLFRWNKLCLSQSPTYLFFLAAPLVLFFAIGILWFSAEKTEEEVPSLSCAPSDFYGKFADQEKLAFFDGREFILPLAVSSLMASKGERKILGTVSGDEKWIEVDLSDQKLFAWEGGKLFLETPISSGLPWSPTPQGEFRIWIKLRYTKMEGGVGKNYYYLPNVPFVMYFSNDEIPGRKGYGLHGTYWHNDFGRPKSHGCVNLPTPKAGELFSWTTPNVSQGKGVVKASGEDMGTRIVIHE